MNKGRVGEERGGKEMDRCPLTTACIEALKTTTIQSAFQKLEYVRATLLT
jgi:hypothetical protein